MSDATKRARSMIEKPKYSETNSAYERMTGGRAAITTAFLGDALSGGAVPVSKLEAEARAAGLLGGRQRITNSKPFKTAKKALEIQSVRDGFGPAGRWMWALPSTNTVPIADAAGHLCGAPNAGQRGPIVDRRSKLHR